jgi:hypothetical protein
MVLRTCQLRALQKQQKPFLLNQRCKIRGNSESREETGKNGENLGKNGKTDI